MFSEILGPEILRVQELIGKDSKAAKLFANCYPNTIETTTRKEEDGSYFVFTGDIPALWLRDSSAQVRHYLPLAKQHKEIAEFIAGLCHRQAFYILTDPYANAYNEEPNGRSWAKDRTEQGPWVWEHKYEIDSLCYPIQLAYLLWKETGEISQFDETFHQVLQTVTDLWILEQHHENSKYYFERTQCPPSDTLPHEGKGNPVGYTGMTWSGFRPSDDACKYGYLIPSEMFAVVVLDYAKEILDRFYHDDALAEKVSELKIQIQNGIEQYGKVQDEEFGEVYAYEVDGLGNVNFMDDANVPSLLSIPYLGYVAPNDPVYINTRNMILSKRNPYYYEGTALSGIGSPHTPNQYIWHIALSMQGLTTEDPEELERLFTMLISSDGDTGFMHEGVYKNDPTVFTRPWFAWSNSIFCEFIYHYLEFTGKNK